MELKFKIGNRVKCWYHDKWWPGTIVDFPPRLVRVSRILFGTLTKSLEDVRVVDEDDTSITYEHPSIRIMLVKTDEKVGDGSDALLDGHGLKGPINSPFIILEDEPEPDTSDIIFRNH